jgi:predicted Zn-dependent protease
MGQFRAQMSEIQTRLAKLEQDFRASPTNLQIGLQLATTYMESQRTGAAAEVLDQIAANPQADISMLLSVAQSYAQLGNRLKVDAVLQRLRRRSRGRRAIQCEHERHPAGVPAYLRVLVTQQTNLAVGLTDALVARRALTPNVFLSAAQLCAQIRM